MRGVAYISQSLITTTALLPTFSTTRYKADAINTFPAPQGVPFRRFELIRCQYESLPGRGFIEFYLGNMTDTRVGRIITSPISKYDHRRG